MVLAGGGSRRMGVADKTRLQLAGASLLDRACAAAAGAERLVVVGEPRPLAGGRQPTWTREEPPGGGPAAAFGAGLVLVTADLVVLLAGDLPFVTRPDVERLVAAVAAGTPAGAVALDRDGRLQWLCSAWRRVALETADLRAGSSLHAALSPLRPMPVTLPESRAWSDCDTPEDLRRARLAARPASGSAPT